MNKFDKLDLALKMLKDNHKIEIAYAMMYGYLSAMVDDKRADELLKLITEKVGK